MLDAPKIDDKFKAQQDERRWQVEIKRRNAISTVTYDFNPLDAVGWHGDLSAVRINWRDFRPLMSHRYHLPPSAHTTFVASRFVVCTFVPRPFETDPGAMKVPFFHNNDDYDEVIFYHQGNFFSRDNIHPGMLTFHPCGFTHGPHPKALGRMFKQTRTRDRRGRGHDRYARRARDRGGRRQGRVDRLCRQLGRRRAPGGRGMKLASLKEGGRDGTPRRRLARSHARGHGHADRADAPGRDRGLGHGRARSSNRSIGF